MRVRKVWASGTKGVGFGTSFAATFACKHRSCVWTNEDVVGRALTGRDRLANMMAPSGGVAARIVIVGLRFLSWQIENW
jgi:hypothetical protein